MLAIAAKSVSSLFSYDLTAKRNSPDKLHRKAPNNYNHTLLQG